MTTATRRTSRLARLPLCGGLLLAVAGCNIGKGGTGEMVVPRQRLSEVGGLDLNAVPQSQPTTASTPTTSIAPPTRPAAFPATEPTTAPATQRAPAEAFLTLADVRRLALQNNLDLRVELLNPTIARTSVTEAEAAYEAVFFAGLDYARTDAATASQLTNAQAENWAFTAGVDIPLRTGGTIRFSTPLSRSEVDNAFTFLNPAYSAGPTATISQPLLRGFGIDYNAQRIRVAFYALQRAEARTKLEVTRVLADTERAYWRVYAAREALKVRVVEVQLAQSQLRAASNRLRQDLGLQVDVVRAESGLADRQEAVLLAGRDLRDRERELKRLLNAPDLDVGEATAVIPATPPAGVANAPDADKLFLLAEAGRMELLETELAIAEQTANVRAARNDTLPLVTFEYTYGVNGLGASVDASLSQVRRADYQDHRAGLRMEVPIGNEAALSRLRRSLYTRSQQLATKALRRQQIRQEVFAAVDALEVNRMRIDAARKRVELALRVFRGEESQYALGRRTSTEVLDAQTRLADARLSEIVAVTDYQIAQVDVAFATGMVLGQSRVAWEPRIGSDIERGE